MIDEYFLMQEYIYESPDKGKTIYRRKIMELDREEVQIDDLLMAVIEEQAAKYEVTCDYYMQEFV